MNINDIVEVELLPPGVTIVEQEQQKYGKLIFTIEERGGAKYLRTELWQVMQLFGHLMYHGQPHLPMKTEFVQINTVSE